MEESHRKEIEDFVQRYFEKPKNWITIIEYSKTSAGIHIGGYYNYTFTKFNHTFTDNLSFHLNIFTKGESWEFKPSFEQTHMITNILDPIQHEALEVKKTQLPHLGSIIITNRGAIKNKMIEMNNNGRFDDEIGFF